MMEAIASKQKSRKAEIKMFNSNVKMVLFYACETWAELKSGSRRNGNI